MAYARKSEHCDVYVYADAENGGFTCLICDLPESINWITNTKTLPEMLAHLHRHRKAGHHVPNDVIDRMQKEIAEKV